MRDGTAKTIVSAIYSEEVKEAPPGFEPGMADLQSAALATWLRRQIVKT